MSSRINLKVMIRSNVLVAAMCAILASVNMFAQKPSVADMNKNLPKKWEILKPDTTCVYAIKGTDTLRLDVYKPLEGSETMYNGKVKPTILYVFGGAFVTGERDAILQLRWYKKLVEEGFPVVAIDYRLALKNFFMPNQATSGNQTGKSGKKPKVKKMEMAKMLPVALQQSVEDLYTATAYLLEHGDEFGVDARNMVVTGSSAGAMAVLQADYQMCNHDYFTERWSKEVVKTGKNQKKMTKYIAAQARIDALNQLPRDFRYSGVISFSGGVWSTESRPDYREATPVPTLLIHGVDDRIVTFKQIRFFNYGFFGSSKLVSRLDRYDCSWRFMRYTGCGHEIAGSMTPTFTEQLTFIYENVMDGKHKIVDATLQEPGIDSRFRMRTARDITSFYQLNMVEQ